MDPGVGYCSYVVLFILSVIMHEVLLGVAWCIGQGEGWKSICIGMMWEILLRTAIVKAAVAGTYLFGCLFPGMILGIGIYVAAFITGSAWYSCG